jgi:hypothetical protein
MTAVEAAARAIQAYQARNAFPPEQYTWDAIPQEWRDRHLAAALVMVEAAAPLLAEADSSATRARLADATILLIEAVQHGGLPAVLRQRINGFLAEQREPATGGPVTAGPVFSEDGCIKPNNLGDQTCGFSYVSFLGTLTCSRYAHTDSWHWDSLGEFGWHDPELLSEVPA